MTMVAVQKGYVVRTVWVLFHASSIDHRALACLTLVLGTRVMICVSAFKTSQSRMLAGCDGTRTHMIRRLLDQPKSPQGVGDDDGGSPKRLHCPHRVRTFSHLLNRLWSPYMSYPCARIASHSFRQCLQPGYVSWHYLHPKTARCQQDH